MNLIGYLLHMLILFNTIITAEGLTQDQLHYMSCLLQCGDKYGEWSEKRLLNDEIDTYIFNTTSHSSFLLCKLGCRLPTFEENLSTPFLEGQNFIKKQVERVNSIIPPSSVHIFCADVSNRLGLSGRFRVTITAARMKALYLVEVIGLTSNESHFIEERVVTSKYSFFRTAFVGLNASNEIQFYKVRVTVVTLLGVSFNQTESRWYSSEELFPSGPPQLQLFMRSQRLVDGLVDVTFGWKDRGSKLSFCSLIAEWTTPDFPGLYKQMRFIADQTLSFSLHKLDFSKRYMLQLLPQYGENSNWRSNNFWFHSSSCEDLTTNLSHCPPASVSNVEWKRIQGNKASVSWSYSSHNSEALLMHFTVVILPIPVLEYGGCPNLKTEYLNVPSNHRSVQFEIPESCCNYEISITAVDFNGRRSSVMRSYKIECVEETQWILYFLVLTAVLAILFCCFYLLCQFFNVTRFCYNEKRERSIGSCFQSQPACIFPSTYEDNLLYYQSPGSCEDCGRFQDFSKSTNTIARRLTSRNPSFTTIDLNTELSPRFLIGNDTTPLCSSTAPNLSPCFLPEKIFVCSTDTLKLKTNAYDIRSHPNFEKIAFLPQNEVVFQGELGSGSFGQVKLAAIRGMNVAVKIAHDEGTVRYRKNAFLKEAKVCLDLCTSNHNFITQIRAIVCDNGSLQEVCGLAFEFCAGGNLKVFLKALKQQLFERIFPDTRNNFELTNENEDDGIGEKFKHILFGSVAELEKYAKQVAKAMEYISKRRFVHRDIAARNILLKYGYNDIFNFPLDQHVKIADFGLCVPLKDKDTVVYNSRTRLPFKWLPCEFFDDNEYGLEGDVWEYGCFLIEVLTLGDDPSIMVQKNNRTYRRDDIEDYIKNLSTGISTVDFLFGKTLRGVAERTLDVNKRSRIDFPTVCKIFGESFQNTTNSITSGAIQISTVKGLIV